MSTIIRPTITPKSPYYISKERYYELKHFCLQYADFKRKMAEFSVFSSGGISVHSMDKTGDLAVNFALYGHYTEMIETCCTEAGGDISQWLFSAVTNGKSYSTLNPPCCKDYFYTRYRKFFWLLDKVR